MSRRGTVRPVSWSRVRRFVISRCADRATNTVAVTITTAMIAVTAADTKTVIAAENRLRSPRPPRDNRDRSTIQEGRDSRPGLSFPRRGHVARGKLAGRTFNRMRGINSIATTKSASPVPVIRMPCNRG